MEDSLVFIHLSDIHFKEGLAFDINKDLRNELEFDAKELAKELGHIDGILITGDIAFSGNEKEYSNALDWLESLCKKIDCPISHVWSIPGNHDVNWDVIKKSKPVRSIQSGLLSQGREDIDTELEDVLSDPDSRITIYRPIENYNSEFASKINCQIDADTPCWSNDFFLNDGSILRIRGINSTLVSNDKDEEPKLILGSFQSTLNRQEGVEYLIMCHHPYDWLIEKDQLRDHWQNRTKIQLFGHKHRQRLDEVNDCLIITSGAMHPSKREPDWKPIYNGLRIYTVVEDDDRKLSIDVFQREWREEEHRFKPVEADGKAFRNFKFPIDDWNGQDTRQLDPTSDKREKKNVLAVVKQAIGVTDTESTKGTSASNEVSNMDPARRLSYQYLRLPYHKKIRIASDLDLIREEDSGVKETELFKQFFIRAKTNKKLKNLWTEVEQASKKGDLPPNPYE